jgi:hypothetical protein
MARSNRNIHGYPQGSKITLQAPSGAATRRRAQTDDGKGAIERKLARIYSKSPD